MLQHGSGTTIFIAKLSLDPLPRGGDELSSASSFSSSSSSESPTTTSNSSTSSTTTINYLDVVVKAPRWGLDRDDLAEVEGELRHEAKFLSQLDHPNIIKIYGWGHLPSRLYGADSHSNGDSAS